MEKVLLPRGQIGCWHCLAISRKTGCKSFTASALVPNVKFFVKILIEMNVNIRYEHLIFLRPVVQSIISLTSLLRGQLI